MALRRSIVRKLDVEFIGKNNWRVSESTYNSNRFILYQITESGRRYEVGSFGLEHDPTCCGADILTGLCYPPNREEILSILPLIAEDVAKHRIEDSDGDDIRPENDSNVGLLYFTHSDENIIAAVKKAGWQEVIEFYNPNSGNNVTFLIKRLYPAPKKQLT